MSASLSIPLLQDLPLFDDLLTPALVIYPSMVRHNIEKVLALLKGDASRWRPHVKTVKLQAVMEMLTAQGITNMKCATTLELLAACRAGASDVLVAYAHAGANAERIVEIASIYPAVRVSCMVEHVSQIEVWRNTPISLFIDVNPGMNRTGADEHRADLVAELASAIRSAGIEFRGLHYYDGHMSVEDLLQRTELAHAGYRRLLILCEYLASRQLEVEEIITSGTPALPCALSFAPFQTGSFHHQISPGTIVYNDSTSLQQLPAEYDLQPAAFVVSRVISRPASDRVTCDAGHKAVSVDSGVPNCVVVNHPELIPMKPSEEHLPFELRAGFPAPPLGSYLQLLPRHVCPTVNNFDSAVLVEHGALWEVAPVSARGHEGPLRPVS